jgi:hypothetical protein
LHFLDNDLHFLDNYLGDVCLGITPIQSMEPDTGSTGFTLTLTKHGTNMTGPRFEEDRGRLSSGHYSRWSDPWRAEDDWGPLTAAVLSFIILVGLIFYGTAHLVAV